VIIKLGSGSQEYSSTSSIHPSGGTNCLFDHSASFPYHPDTNVKSLEFIVMDNDLVGKDDEVGRGHIDAATLFQSKGASGAAGRHKEAMSERDVALVHKSRLSGRGKKVGYLRVAVRWELIPSNGGNDSMLYLPLPALSCLVSTNTGSGILKSVLDNGTVVAIKPFRTYNLDLWDVDNIFKGLRKGWNKDYDAAQQIYGKGPSSMALRAGMRAQYSMVYEKNPNGNSCTLRNIEGLRGLYDMLQVNHMTDVKKSKSDIFLGNSTEKWNEDVSPRYTYTIMPDSRMYFSRTGKDTMQDLLSKHALTSNVGEEVVYCGEFFFDTKSAGAVETNRVGLVIDNNSGTFGPPKARLGMLQLLMEMNFGTECEVRALDREDPLLEELVKVNQVA